LAKAGKRWRPFLAASVYRALAPGSGPLPETIRTTAIALECIHKASLVYDDIQDGDDCRYGEPTLHCLHGVPIALTVSLFLLGHGYRLIAECGAPAEMTRTMMNLATQGHCQLCLGQGEEMWWMRHPTPVSAAQVLEFFRRKTAPSFEVVFRLGAVCAGADEQTHEALQNYSQAVGVAYQIQDDLKDFRTGGDVDDIRSMRPSILLGIAHDRAEKEDRETIARIWRHEVDDQTAETIRGIIGNVGAEQAARELIDEYRQKALRSLAPLRQASLKTLLHRLAYKILAGTTTGKES
jgi:geranylgeranyl diphosphate synthase, type II